jgi:hypothetical protein
MVIEAKYCLYDNGYKEVSEAYMQAFEYRNAQIIDKRFAHHEAYRMRPPAVFLCSDLIRKHIPDYRAQSFEWISRTLGRRGVYALSVTEHTVYAFTDHGKIFDLCNPDSCVLTNHTALRFSGGISDWNTIQFLLSSDNKIAEFTEEIAETARRFFVPPFTPDDCLGDHHLEKPNGIP